MPVPTILKAIFETETILRRSDTSHSVTLKRFTDPYLIAGALAFGVGCVWIFLQSMGWYYAQQSIAVYAQASILALVLRYYAVEGFAILTIVAGVYVMHKSLLSTGENTDQFSIRTILTNALSSRKDVRLGLVAAVAYAIIYALVSSILVYQPGIDFGAAYGVTTTSWNAAACCGLPGTVPTLLIYVAPQAHLALQVVPLDALFVVLVPILVGMNIAVAAYAVRSQEVRSNTKWFGSIGVLAGLFTGCPTCAGIFLASAVGGLGATSLAVALAPYQTLFILVSIPLLLASPVITAFSIRRSMQAACPVPVPSPKLTATKSV